MVLWRLYGCLPGVLCGLGFNILHGPELKLRRSKDFNRTDVHILNACVHSSLMPAYFSKKTCFEITRLLCALSVRKAEPACTSNDRRKRVGTDLFTKQGPAKSVSQCHSRTHPTKQTQRNLGTALPPDGGSRVGAAHAAVCVCA